MTLSTLPTDPAAMSPGSVTAALEVDANVGLSSEEVLARRQAFGSNELPTEPPTPFWKLVLAQFEDTLVRILLLAAMVSFVMALIENNASDFVEPFIILLILVLNATVGVWQENRAEGAIEALKSFVPKTAVVLREGKTQTVNAEDLVPGDLVEVAVGNRVPADMRVLKLHSTTLRADQSILNGESLEAMKQAEAVKGRQDRFPASMVYSGTAIVYGKALCVVVRTGVSTEIGAIERGVREQEDEKTPLQVKLDEFGVLLSKVIGYICIAVFAVNMVRWYATHTPSAGETWFARYVQPSVHCLKVAVALAVAAIPEGLPAVVTTCLALGTRRMARHNALVRDLPSVETLGRCTVICSDKTGTLTTNMMSVLDVFTLRSDGEVHEYLLKDSKFNVVAGAVTSGGVPVATALETDAALSMLSNIAVLCNDASLHLNAPSGQVEKIGEATEAALLVMAEKLADPKDVSAVSAFRTQAEQRWKKNATLEFTRQRKSMSVHVTAASPNTAKSGTHSLFVKGAPEEILRRSTHVMQDGGVVVRLTAELRARVVRQLDRMSGGEHALRCIGFAFKPAPPLQQLQLSDPSTFEEIESDLTFVGACGMLDPPREEVRDAISKCRTAGIRVVVITGDRKETAEAICFKLGLLSSTANTTGLSYTGAEFDAMTVAAKREAIGRAVLFSRTDPSHKMQLVQLFKDEKLICAMTGDGVNDAPALKKADIGIAMGSGTEVAKSASKMVLADDNFATVVKAVREGRAIFNNTKQFIRYLISSNIGEVVCILVTGLFGLPEALSPVQLLWVNLVTDGLPATALGFNAPDADIMEQRPRRMDEPIVNGWLFMRYMVIGVYVGLATVGGFLWWFLGHGFTLHDLTTYTTCKDMTKPTCTALADPETARAIALSILVVVEMLNALNALSENASLITMRPHTNVWLLLAIVSSLTLHLLIMYVPFLAALFNIAPLGVDPQVVKQAHPWSILVPTNFDDWKAVMVFSVPVIFLDELLKLVTRRMEVRRKRKQD
ncbi:putative Cation transporter ATPase N terminus [Trypanosoma vivax]|uniref:Calcium-transporting ATPase n=1 Tax=Trypanosoma vivax (strain Y486) TaxID=1055687 RepID=G0TVW9_TRYVY|nr:putative calcium-translocating P-type ATPase [Trypanosoma vivax]KAH8607190.1 putative Cation transporter ATPase N terminus [Trypanosoma vivax]KAH8607237.1 putative Cation transporter ATPase N terminus [Trypanosoma vivax]CCC48085.1 putative calcium-translocating P-type ATPase [Trypanosoma vivax Y486]